jgi:hypothetical protein
MYFQCLACNFDIPVTICCFSIGSPQCLASIYRLLRLSQVRLNSGDLEPIEATLGCPVVMPQSILSDKMESLSQQEKEVICASVIYCINWMLEVRFMKLITLIRFL